MTQPVEKEFRNWENCYEGSWKGHIVDPAFAHPAKMAYGLLERIYDHAFEQGWLQEGAVVVDPFGGIGSTGILGAYRGLRVICCELEAKFTGLAMQNMWLHLPKWRALGCPVPVIIQGDSRNLCELVKKADVVVGSPPFSEAQTGGGIAQKGYHNEQQRKGVFDLVGKRSYMPENLGRSAGNLGNMKAGSVDAVVSSPPYCEAVSARGGRQRHEKSTGKEHPRETSGEYPKIGQSQRSGIYSNSSGNLGNMPVADLILSSPPYNNRIRDEGNPSDSIHRNFPGDDSGRYSATYPSGNDGQVGNMKDDTFWQAAAQIVSQCHQLLKPKGMAIWVVKDFVRNKKRVDFTGDWQRLCESLGFETVCVHHAMLVKEKKSAGLFGQTIIDRTERKSFFRRLTDRKAAENGYWATLDQDECGRWVKYARERAWKWYNLLTDEEKEELIIRGQPDSGLKYPKPSEASILSDAKGYALDADDGDPNEYNKHVRIDYEVVMCMRKSQINK